MRIFTTGLLIAAPIAFPVSIHASLQDETSAEEIERPSDLTEIVCRRMPPPTGSRLRPRNICKTQHQWNLHDDEREQFLVDRQREDVMTNNCPSPAGCD